MQLIVQIKRILIIFFYQLSRPLLGNEYQFSYPVLEYWGCQFPWAQFSILDAGYWMLDVGCWMLDAGAEILIIGIEHRVSSIEYHGRTSGPKG
jgi:hypothetical protein